MSHDDERMQRWLVSASGDPEPRLSSRLPGGTHAVTEVVTRSTGADLVLRTFPIGDPAVERERLVLDLLDGLDGLAPRLVAADADGSHTGAPRILTTRLVGRASLAPADPLEAARQLGEALARVHAVPADARLRRVMTPLPAASGLVSLGDELAREDVVFTHNDFWSGNTLWRGGRLSGIVDWSGAGLAPRGRDLAWARQDLVLLHGRAVADRFAATYGTRHPLPDLDRWDRYAAAKADPAVETWEPNYVDLGRTDLDAAGLRRRLDAWMHELGMR